MKFRLLTVGNPKTEKGAKLGYLTAVLHLAPADLSGFNVCPAASEGCRKACLNTAGRGGIAAGQGILTYDAVKAGKVNAIQAARIRRTRWYFQDRESFMAALAEDIAKAKLWAFKLGLKLAVRLNGTSDIPWHRVRTETLGGRTIMETYPEVQFYDYTKVAKRLLSEELPSNYRVVYSLTEEAASEIAARQVLQGNGNVAVVFRNTLPTEFMGRPVINGDDTDLRFLDPLGVVIGLKAKGNAKRDISGFVRP